MTSRCPLASASAQNLVGLKLAIGFSCLPDIVRTSRLPILEGKLVRVDLQKAVSFLHD